MPVAMLSFMLCSMLVSMADGMLYGMTVVMRYDLSNAMADGMSTEKSPIVPAQIRALGLHRPACLWSFRVALLLV